MLMTQNVLNLIPGKKTQRTIMHVFNIFVTHGKKRPPLQTKRSNYRSRPVENLKIVQKNGKKKGFCFRHPDKRNINRGICLKARPRACDAHTDCNGFGGKCCNGHCCNDKYFKEIMKIPCVTNEGCQDMLTGDHCCIDLSGAIGGWKVSQSNWEKRCCSNERGPVIPPPDSISPNDIKKVNTQIGRMPLLKESICNGMNYPLMMKFGQC